MSWWCGWWWSWGWSPTHHVDEGVQPHVPEDWMIEGGMRKGKGKDIEE